MKLQWRMAHLSYDDRIDLEFPISVLGSILEVFPGLRPDRVSVDEPIRTKVVDLDDSIRQLWEGQTKGAKEADRDWRFGASLMWRTSKRHVADGQIRGGLMTTKGERLPGSIFQSGLVDASGDPMPLFLRLVDELKSKFALLHLYDIDKTIKDGWPYGQAFGYPPGESRLLEACGIASTPRPFLPAPAWGMVLPRQFVSESAQLVAGKAGMTVQAHSEHVLILLSGSIFDLVSDEILIQQQIRNIREILPNEFGKNYYFGDR